jgi:hypothetical protein
MNYANIMITHHLLLGIRCRYAIYMRGSKPCQVKGVWEYDN